MMTIKNFFGKTILNRNNTHSTESEWIAQDLFAIKYIHAVGRIVPCGIFVPF